METKHTQGKWELQKDNCIINIYGGAIICQMGSANNNDVEKEANAKLIASAPELLEALQCAYLNCKNLTPEADDFIKSVILKATK